jgi:hypothetical protein
MSDITISNNVDLNVDLKIRDDSPLAKAKLTQLASTSRQLFGEFEKPLDQIDVRSFTLSGNLPSAGLLDGDLTLSAGGGMNCTLSVSKAPDKLLFPADGFSPTIPINTNEAWLGIEFDLTASAKVGVSANGVGVAFDGTTKMACSSYSLFSAKLPPLPLFREACADGFENFLLITRSQSIRDQNPNTVNVNDLSGSITVTVSLDQPFAFNPLASATLPFNETATIQPAATLKLATSLRIDGDFLVRSYKMSENQVVIGVYKKQGSTLTVSLTADAGVEGDIGKTDVFGTLLNAALPGVDVASSGITGDNAKKFNDVIQKGLNRCLSAQVNATCSAAFTHEAAVLYQVELETGDQGATDRALDLALRGDWTALEALKNATRLRNIAVETVDKKQSFTINLFGFYSATSTADYLKSCTVLVDNTGQVTITDKIDFSRINASTDPYATDTAKLRQALMEDFLCTASYVVLNGKIGLKLSATQSYLDYKQSMSRDEIRENIRLGYGLGVIPPGSLDAVLATTPSFNHACVSAIVHYDMPALENIFYKEPQTRTQHTRAELERVGRDVMCTLLDPFDGTDSVRLSILRNDDVWLQMDNIGDTAAFNTIAGLGNLRDTQLGAVSADWVSIVWWAKALVQIAPALDSALGALENAPAQNPQQDASFMRARANLANVLGTVTRKTDAAFVHGWGASVLFALSERHGSAQMTLTWNSKTLQYGAPAAF